DEVGLLLGHELAGGLGALEEAGAGESAGADGDAGLVGVVADAGGVEFGVGEGGEAVDLVFVQDAELPDGDGADGSGAEQAEDPAVGGAGGEQHTEHDDDHDHDRPEVGHEHHDQHGHDGEAEGLEDGAAVGEGSVPGVDPGGQQHGHAEDDRELDELGGLQGEAAGQFDPGVGAVDGGAERRQHEQDQEDRGAVQDGHGGAQGAVAEPDGADHQGESDAGVQPVPDQEVVRVALVEFGAVAGRRVDQQGAEHRQDERRQQYRPVEAPDQGVAGEDAGPSAPLGSVSGDLEAVHA